MKIWVLMQKAPTWEDAAYLTGHIASRFDQVLTSHVTETDKQLPAPPPGLDAIFNYGFHTGEAYLLELDVLAARLGVPVVNCGSRALRACDKRSYLEDFPGLTPQTWVANSIEEIESLRVETGSELVLKPPLGKHGKGIMRFAGSQDRAAARALLAKRPQASVVAQEFCSGFVAGDKRVIVHRSIDGGFDCAAWFARVPPPGGWISNFRAGGQILPCDLEAEERRLALRVAEVADLDYAGIDLAWHKGRCLLIETNAYSGGHINFDTEKRGSSGDDFARMVRHIAEHGRPAQVA